MSQGCTGRDLAPVLRSTFLNFLYHRRLTDAEHLPLSRASVVTCDGLFSLEFPPQAYNMISGRRSDPHCNNFSANQMYILRFSV